MEIFITLLSQFLSGQLSIDEFISEFIKARHKLVNEQDAVIDRDIATTQVLNQLWDDFKQNRITGAEYAEQMKITIQKLGGFRIHPFSRTAEIVDHMMVEADAYYGDPPPDKSSISSEQLRIEASNALKELVIIQQEQNNRDVE